MGYFYDTVARVYRSRIVANGYECRYHGKRWIR
jgi:hypothetical protein